MDESQAAGLVVAGIFGFIAVMALISIAIGVVICLILQGCIKKVPERHRKVTPGFVWLLLIPCANVVINFFVIPKISQSFQSYFAELGDDSVGDCAHQIGLWYCICVAVAMFGGMVPIIGGLAAPVAGLASLVLLIMYLVKATGLKNKINYTDVGTDAG